MKKKVQYLVLICLGMTLFIFPSFAEDIYVAGITKVTMRTGSGVEHKIIDILKTGDKLEIVEYKNDWSLVKTNEGREGWVLSRFLTQEIPDAFIIEKLEKDNQDLISRLDAAEQENKNLSEKNMALVQIQAEFDKLKQECGDFLKLNAEYKKIMEQSSAQKEQIKTLENSLNKEQKYFLLSGAGVLVFGLFLGLVTRKKKRTSLL